MNLESVFEKNESNLIIFTLLCIILVVFHHLTRYIIFIQQKILPHPKRIAVTPLLQTIHNMLYIVLAKILLENHFLFYLLTFLIHTLSFLYSINIFFFFYQKNHISPKSEMFFTIPSKPTHAAISSPKFYNPTKLQSLSPAQTHSILPLHNPIQLQSRSPTPNEYSYSQKVIF